MTDYESDELDYFVVYDMISDILSRFSDTSFTASNQLFKMRIQGLAERIVFDVLISDYFQLPNMAAPHLHYIAVATVMERNFKRIGFVLCPIMLQALNLCFKKLPRMDPEIKTRFETFYCLIMNHLDFSINADVLKKITDKESEHYKGVKSLFNRLTIFTYHKKLEDIIKEKKLPEDWLTENYSDPVFVHGEDENDIKNICEKMKFRDESKEEFDSFLESDDLENKSALQEFLFEGVFRKANRNYSFMVKVLDHYSETLKQHLTDKAVLLTMLSNMFKHNWQRLFVFIHLFLRSGVLSTADLVSWLSQQPEQPHLSSVSQGLADLYVQKQQWEEAVQVLEWVGSTSQGLPLLRKHKAVLEQEGHWQRLKDTLADKPQLQPLIA